MPVKFINIVFNPAAAGGRKRRMKMNTFFNCTSHPLSGEQRAALKDSEVLSLTPENQKKFSQVPAKTKLDLSVYTKSIQRQLATLPNRSRVLVQGESTVTHFLVEMCFRLGLTPIAAVTRREAVEDPKTGVKTSVFKHLGWRPYLQYKEKISIR